MLIAYVSELNVVKSLGFRFWKILAFSMTVGGCPLTHSLTHSLTYSLVASSLTFIDCTTASLAHSDGRILHHYCYGSAVLHPELDWYVSE